MLPGMNRDQPCGQALVSKYRIPQLTVRVDRGGMLAVGKGRRLSRFHSVAT